MKVAENPFDNPDASLCEKLGRIFEDRDVFLRNSITDLFYKNRFMVGSKLYLGMDKGMGEVVGCGGREISMEEFLKEIGLIIKWMDLEYLLGVMVECKYIYYQYLFLVILVNIKKIKNMVTEIFNGLMVVNIKYFNIFNIFNKYY